MGKKLSSLALCLVFLLGLMPNISLMAAGTAAKKPTSIKVGGTEVIAGGYWTTKDGKLAAGDKNNWNVRYDKSTNTLYLKNAVVKSEGDKPEDGASANGDLNLKIEGTNNLTGRAGLTVEGNLITNTTNDNSKSTLVATGTRMAGNSIVGMNIKGDLTVLNGEIKGTTNGRSNINHAGVNVIGNTTIKSGSIAGICDIEQPSQSTGFRSGGDVTVYKSAKLIGTTTAHFNNTGLRIDGNLTVDGGTVTGTVEDIIALGFSEGLIKCGEGMNVKGTLKLTNGGSVTGTAGNTTGYAYGIRAGKYEIINGILKGTSGKVTADNYNVSESYGIYTASKDPIIFKAGQIIAKSVNNTGLKAFLPTTPFWFRTMESMDFADGLTEAFKPDQAAYVEMITNGTNVSYDANGGAGKMTDDYVYHNGDVKITVPKCEFTKEGHKFVGFKRADNGEIVQPGKEIKFSTKDSASTLKLIAVWEKNKGTSKPTGKGNKPADKNTHVPQTGDNTKLLPIVSVILLSAAALLAVLITSKKEKFN